MKRIWIEETDRQEWYEDYPEVAYNKLRLLSLEDAVRAVVHGWTNCDPVWHIDVRAVFESLASGGCGRKNCDCQEAEEIQRVIEHE